MPHESILVTLGDTPVGCIEVVQGDSNKLKFTLKGESFSEQVKLASDRLAQKSPDELDRSVSVESAACLVSNGILIELKEAGLLKDVSLAARTVRCSIGDLTDFNAIMWVKYPQQIVMPRCIPFTRAEVCYAVKQSVYNPSKRWTI